jgi:ribosomal protein S18 acetylase RimI-like enzyme
MQSPLRRATPSDAAALSQLAIDTFVETFAHLYQPEHLERFLAERFYPEKQAAEINDPTLTTWVVEDAAGLCAYAMLGPNRFGDTPSLRATKGSAAIQRKETDWIASSSATPRNDDAHTAELQRLYVYSRAQGKGLGKQLIHLCIDTATRQGVRALYLGVWEQNFRAQTLYASFGFERVGEHFFDVGGHQDIDWILCRAIG